MRRRQVVSRVLPFFHYLDGVSRYNVKIEACSALFFGLFAGAIYPFFSVTAVRLGAASFLLAIITAAPFMGQLFAVYWGHRCEQGPKKPYVIYSGLFSRFLLAFLALSRDPRFFALFVVLHFMTASIGGPAFTALYKKVYPLSFRGQIMGRMQFIIGIARVLMTYGAGLWLDRQGYTELFLVASVLGIISSMIFDNLKEPQERVIINKRKFSLKILYNLLKNNKLLKMAMIGFFIFDLGNLILAPIYPLVQVNHLGMSNFQIGQLAIFWMIGWFITAPFWGYVNDRYRPLYNILIAIALFTISPLIYFFEASYPFLIVASLSWGAAGSSLEVGWLNMMIRLGGENASQYSGLYLTVLGLRGLIAPVLGIVLYNYLPANSIFLLSFILIVSGLIPFILYKKLEDQEERGEKANLCRVNFNNSNVKSLS